MNLKQIIYVLDNENELVQNRRKFATRGKKPHTDNSCQFCKIKVLRVAVVFEDGVSKTTPQNSLSILIKYK